MPESADAHDNSLATTLPPIPADYEDVLGAIAGATVCQGWDVVCSYHLDELNKMLQANLASSGKSSVTVPFSGTGVDIAGNNYSVDGSVILGTPGLSFSAPGLNGMCQVTMPIASGVYVLTVPGSPPGTPTQIAGGQYSIGALVYLNSVWGDGTPADPGATGVIEFGTVTDKAHITLHFTTDTSTTWSLIPEGGVLTVLTEYVLPAVKAQFAKLISEIDYTLCSVSNDPVPSGVDVVPKRFSFVTFQTGDSGVLSIFIETGAGTATGKTVPPLVHQALVSTDHLVSMIFSPAFMGGGYIQPQLNAQGATSPPAATGPSYQVYLTNNSPVIPTSAVNIRQSLTADEGVDFDATTVPLAQQPFTIAFTATTMTVSVSFAVQQSWQHFIITSKGGAPDYNGTATVSIALSKQLPLTTAVTVGDGGLQINTTIAESDFSISTDPGTGARCWNSDAENSIATATQGAVTGVLPSSLSVNCGNLDYLRVKNLLFPGQNVIQVDTTVGLCVPYDFVVFGNFEASSGTV